MTDYVKEDGTIRPIDYTTYDIQVQIRTIITKVTELQQQLEAVTRRLDGETNR